MSDVVSCPCCEWAAAHALVEEYDYCPQCGKLLRAGEVVA